MKLDPFLVKPGKSVSLRDYDTGYTAGIKDRREAKTDLQAGIKRLAELQDILYAHDRYSLLVLFQAMDAAGKDGTIKHVMSGVNPQGCQVFAFKAPSAEERDHDYLWRSVKALPERGRIGIHNRSYYEEVLVTRVHPEILAGQQLPDELRGKSIWKRRFEQINNFERYLYENGTRVVKFFLNVSKAEQKRRFLERLDRPEKNWKFSINDVKERQRWDDYQEAYADLFSHTSTRHAPWYVIPADKKWFSRLVVARIIIKTLEDLDMQYPKVGDDHKQMLEEARTQLEAEDS